MPRSGIHHAYVAIYTLLLLGFGPLIYMWDLAVTLCKLASEYLTYIKNAKYYIIL